MNAARPRRHRPAARRAALAATGALALGATLIPAVASAGPESPLSAATRFDGQAADAGATLSPTTFADPPKSVRPLYRWWMPLAYTDDDELRRELRDIAAGGGGGVEVSPFVVPGAGNQSNAFLAKYGWGTPLWAHKMEVITDEAAKLGLQVDQNLGPQYPATVPTLNSFNQKQAEQQLIYGREFVAAGASRSGALPAPTTAPPSVTAQLCAPSSPGDKVLHVQSLGGFAPGDTVTVGAGATAEKVVVKGLGDRTAACGDLSVSALTSAHAAPEAVVDVARVTRLRTLVAQCATACAAGGTSPVKLDPSSIRDVTGKVTDGGLDYSFPTGNGNPWVLIDIQQTASGLIAQKGGYTATQPNYVPDHLSRGGVQIQTRFWDDSILTPTVRANLRRIGRGAVFEDSLEMGSTQKWTWKFLNEFKSRRGYDPTKLLPALLGVGQQGDQKAAFDLGDTGAMVREDYRETVSDLYSDRYVAPMQRWARGHGLEFRVQPYGLPIAGGVASAQAGVPEGESLGMGNFLGTVGPEQGFRALASGAHVSGENVVSSECCAVFLGNYRSSVAGPQVPGLYGQGGDGTQVGGKYSNGLLDSVYKGYAGGVNQVVWHGYAYRDAPAGVGTSGRDGSWPGYHPWDIFGALNVNDEFGPRQASWPDYKNVNDNLSRTQLVLRQGRDVVDLGVYYNDIGNSDRVLAGIPQHLLGDDSATASAGYTYDYIAPGFLDGAQADSDGGFRTGKATGKALVLNNQSTLSVDSAKHLLKLARQGMRIFVVGDAPSTTPGANPDADQLPGLVGKLLSQRSVRSVAAEKDLPAALASAGVRPYVAPEKPTSALGLVRRQAENATYDFVYNRSASTVETDLTLSGTGLPYTLNTWTGRIEPVANYTATPEGVKVRVRIAPYDKVVLALANQKAGLGTAPSLHAVSSNGDVVSAEGGRLTVRTTQDGRVTAKLSDGTTRTADVDGLAPGRRLDTWTLDAQTWTPGANQYTTVKTDQPQQTLTAKGDGTLPSWREISTPVDLSKSSGIGVYTTTVDLPATWKNTDGAYLSLGKVLDTATVTVNGKPVTVNQSGRDRVDLGNSLRAGSNTIVVKVATTLFNAVRASGDSNYQIPDWQNTGLMGPISLTPYRDSVLTAVTGTR
ncbi:glycosyl hydrolase [Streptomyces sp. NPDC090088]|uniref:glycosyl hydrolase n=1 Tax=Streptomyces sp. NPDC090088 TaxID=3365944 RepID=UPI00381EBD48